MFQNSALKFVGMHGAPCPYCGGATLCPSPRELGVTIWLSERQETLLTVGWLFAGRPEDNGHARPERDIFAEFFDSEDGEPDLGKAYRDVRKEFEALIPKVAPFGMYFSFRPRAGLDLKLIADPRVSAAPLPAGRPPLPPMPCPVCQRHMASPTLEQTMHRCEVPHHLRQWVRAINCLGGKPADPELVFASRYRDEPNPPPPEKQKRNLIEAISMLNRILREHAAGFSVQSQGYRQGYRIVYGAGP